MRVGFYLPTTKETFIYGKFQQYAHMDNSWGSQKGSNGYTTPDDGNFSKDIKLSIDGKKDITENFVVNQMTLVRIIHPIIRNNQVITVVWGETIIHPDITTNVDNKDFIYAITLASLMLAIFLIFLVLKNMMNNVNKIIKGLNAMEQNVSTQIEPISGEMGQIASSINKMGLSLKEKEKLEEQLARSEKLAALGHLISGVAHEIRNPLGIIRATVQVMEREFNEVEGIDEYIKVVKEQSDRESKVIQELLDYARPSRSNFSPININLLLKNVLTFTKHYMREKNISMDLKLEEGLPETILDGDKIKQVLINIIINGCEAMEKGGIFTISTTLKNNYVAVSFNDTGVGMDETQLKNIFNPYYTTKPSGTGLGLSISNSIIEMHGGYIDVESKKNIGTIFTIYLPTNNSDGGKNNE